MKFIKRLFSLGRDKDYDRAMDFYNRHMYREAVELFEEILSQKTSSSGLYYNLSRVYCEQAHRSQGVVLYAMGNFSAALKEFQRALQFNPEQVELLYFVGVCQNNLGDFEHAVSTFNTILHTDPSHLPTRLKLGIALHNLKMWDRAADIYSAILSTRPSYADVHFRLGLACLGRGNVEKAVKAFDDALQINPGYVEARMKLAVSQAYIGHFNLALKNIDIILQKHPGFADVHYYKGIVEAGRGEIESATACFQRALDINPAYKEARKKLGILYCRQNNFSAGMHEFEEAARFDPHDKYLAKAIEAVRGRPDMSSQTGGGLPDVLGRIFGSDQNLAQTIQDFNKHAEITPDFSDIVSIVKNFHETDASLEILIPFVQNYLSQHPTYPDIHNTLGSLYYKTHRKPEAEACFREAVRINPDYVNAHINLFTTLKELGSYEDALLEADYLIGKDLPYPDIYCAIGEIHIVLKRFDEARRYAARALEINARYGHAHMIMAEVLEQEGNIDDAVKALNACLESNPPREISLRVREKLLALK